MVSLHRVDLCVTMCPGSCVMPAAATANPVRAIDQHGRSIRWRRITETTTFFPDWRKRVTFAAPRPEPTLLRDADGFRVLLAGLEPGGEIPAHPERLAVYHVLEGRGSMVVDPTTSTDGPGGGGATEWSGRTKHQEGLHGGPSRKT